MDKPQVDYDDEDGRVQRLRPQHPVIWQRDMDYVRLPGEKAQHLPLQKLLMSTQHLLARQCDQHRRPISCWTLHHVHPAKKTSAAHVCCIEDDRIPKDILYDGKLPAGQRGVGRPQLRYKDVCKRDMKVLDINVNSWEDLAADRTSWRSTLQNQLPTCEEKLSAATAEKRARRKETTANKPESTDTDTTCVVATVTLALVSTATTGAA